MSRREVEEGGRVSVLFSVLLWCYLGVFLCEFVMKSES